MKILLIEDEENLSNSIMNFLKREGYQCEPVDSYDDALMKINMYQYDIVLVDITIKGGNGLDVIKKIKEKRINSGIIIISAKNSLDDKIHGLDLGADDYLTKPFHLAELIARIKSVFRRKNFEGEKDIIFNEIKINTDANEVKIHDKPLTLTKKELDLLVYFLANKNRVLTKESIAEHLWGDNIDTVDSFDFIYTHIKNLRKKILDMGGGDYIKSVYGMGYKFEAV
jgi:DNA-binding response OmpR family regulator